MYKYLLWFVILFLVSCSSLEDQVVLAGGGGPYSGTNCGHFICGNHTYTGTGDLTGKTWAAIEGQFAANYIANDHGWNTTQTFSNGSVTLLWVPWASSTDPSEAGLKDTYTQSAYGVNANWTLNSMISDEASEWWMASVQNLTWTQIEQFMNYMDACADLNPDHGSQGPWGTSWACTSRGNYTHRNITKNDENSASDASARYATGFCMAANDPDHTTQQRDIARGRCVNITRFMLAEESVTSCQNSTVNTTEDACVWHLAGASQAWGPGALTQVGQQMFFGYHEPNAMAYLSACRASGDMTLCGAAANETHQFLYVVGYRNSGNGSADFNYTTGGAHYYMNCSVSVASCRTQTQSTSADQDDADAPRMWEMCNVYDYARITYANLSQPLPWQFGALKNYCDAWSYRISQSSIITAGGTPFANGTSACYRITNQSNCSSSGIVGLNSYFGAGLVSNMVAYTNSETFWNTFLAGSLSTYSTTNDYYTGDTYFGIYTPIRTLRSIRAATGYYDFLFVNTTFNRTAYETGAGTTVGGGGGDGGGSGGGNTFVGAINVTVNTPLNQSNHTVNFVIANVTVWNLNNTDVDGGVGNTTRLFCDFSSADDSCNATGGTLNTSTGTYESQVANSQTYTFGPFNHTHYSWFNITVWVWFDNATNTKFYPIENVSTTTGDRYLWDISGGTLRVRPEPNYDKSCTGILNKSIVQYSFVVNRSSGNFSVYVGACSWTRPANTMVVGNYTRFEPGQGRGLMRFYNLTYEVLQNESGQSMVPGNASMNVTFYYQNSTSFYQQDNVSNASHVSYNLSGLSNGNYSWYVTVRSKDNFVNYSALNFSIQVVTPPPPGVGNATLCPAMRSLVWNSNVSRGTYSPTLRRYNESTIYPVNNSCGYTYKLNNSALTDKTFTFTTNYTNTDRNLTLWVNGTMVNASTSKAIVVPAGEVYYVNWTMNLTNWPVLQRPPSINASVVVS